MINTKTDRDTRNIHRLYNCEELQQMYLHTIPAYVYYIRHIPTGKFYYGFRSAHINENRLPIDDLWKTYFTSSVKIKELREQDDTFEVKIIYEDLDVEEAYWVEQDYIKQHINDPLCLNKYYIDKGKDQKIFSMAGKSHTEDSKLKMKGRLPWNTGKKIPRGIPSWNKGIPTPNSVKELIREKTKGIKKSEETKQRMTKPKSKSHAENISKAALQRPKFPCELCGRLITKANIENHRKSHNE